MYDSALPQGQPPGTRRCGSGHSDRRGAGRLGRAPGGGEPSRLTEARALLGSLLDRRVGLAAARLDDRDADAVAVAAARADRNEAIRVTGALLYWLPVGDAAWPEVALALGRLSYERYTDPILV
jgi:hypothetical protein